MSFSLRPNKTLFIRPKWSSSASDPTPASSSTAAAPQDPTTSPTGQLALSRTNSDQISPLQKTGRTSSAPWITTATTPWAPAPWNPDDLAVRRFSKPAVAGHTHALTEHIGSARRAYTKAFTAIHKSVAAKNINVSAVLASSTGEDVAEAALGLYDADASVDKSGASRFVDTLQHYHGVFDVLCQTDFSFLTLIWGGMKLILIVRDLLNVRGPHS